MASLKINFEKLRGRENYDTWKISAKSYLTINGYWSCTQSIPAAGAADQIVEKHMKALSELTLLIEPSCYSYIVDKENAREAWTALEDAFADSGLGRKVSLLQQWVSTRLQDCNSTEDYVNKMTNLWSKVKSVGFKIDEEVAAALMLGGLPKEYKPTILGIESSKDKITVDYVKNLLLQEISLEDKSESENALAIKYRKKKFKKCFHCGGAHYSKKCPQKKKNNNTVNSETVLISSFSVSEASSEWYFDSGASSHMTKNKSLLINIREPRAKEVVVANNQKISVECIGDIKVSAKVNGIEKKFLIKEVQYVPELCVNLLSVSQMVKNDYEVIFHKNGCKVLNSDKNLVITATLECNMFKINTLNFEYACAAKSVDKTTLWHRRLGHVSLSNMHFLNNSSENRINTKTVLNCVTCAEGKQSRLPFENNGTRANGLLELIHTDVCGPMTKKSLGGASYYVSFIDDYSKKIFVYIIKKKSAVFDCFVKFKNLMENQLDKKIKIIRSDNGGEYINDSFKVFCEKHGIIHQKTCSSTPQQNGVSERFNRTIVEKARCMLFDARLPLTFWAEAVNTAVKVINLLPNSTNREKCPDEIWYNSPQDLSFLRIFGTRAMVKIPDEQRKKLEKKSVECVFVGYAENTRGYRLYNLNTKKIIISRDVIFFEEEASVVNKNQLDNHKIALFPEGNDGQPNNTIVRRETDESAGEMVNNDSTVNNDSIVSNENYDTGDETVDNVGDGDDTIADNRNTDPDYIPDESIQASDPRQRPTARGFPNPFNFLHSSFAFTVGEPTKYEDAVIDENWKQAMDDEYESLIKNKTWILTELPSGQKAIDNKWVYKVKHRSNGDVERYKARLVIRGFSQQYDMNYFETYSPVVKFTSVRMILAIAAAENLKLKQFDVKTAFLYADLEEEIYMRQPKGYDDKSGRVCKLLKSLYGLKQASRCWNKRFTSFLKRFEFKATDADPCVFVNIKGKSKTYLALYIDDGLLASNDEKFVISVISFMKKEFEIKFTEADTYLGLQIVKQRDGSIFIHQQNYAEKVLKRFNMEDCNSVAIPADPNLVLHEVKPEKVCDFPYREAIGSLMYLAIATRPDICFAVNYASRHMEKPAQIHVNAVKRILRYIRGTIGYGISYKSNMNVVLSCFSDADYAGDVDTRCSTSGYLFLVGTGAISWASEKQKTVAQSTTESEYIAASQAVKELVWLKLLLRDLSSETIDIPILGIDNQSAIKIIKNPEFHKRTKHIDVRYHFIREKFEKKMFLLKYVSTADQLADSFTKPLPKEKFVKFRNSIGVINQIEL